MAPRTKLTTHFKCRVCGNRSNGCTRVSASWLEAPATKGEPITASWGASWELRLREMDRFFCFRANQSKQSVGSMKRLLYQEGDLEIWKEESGFFVIYDAGAHQVVMRKDEITEEQALRACEGVRESSEMLFALQKRLIEDGVDPYRSNYAPRGPVS